MSKIQTEKCQYYSTSSSSTRTVNVSCRQLHNKDLQWLPVKSIKKQAHHTTPIRISCFHDTKSTKRCCIMQFSLVEVKSISRKFGWFLKKKTSVKEIFGHAQLHRRLPQEDSRKKTPARRLPQHNSRNTTPHETCFYVFHKQHPALQKGKDASHEWSVMPWFVHDIKPDLIGHVSMSSKSNTQHFQRQQQIRSEKRCNIERLVLIFNNKDEANRQWAWTALSASKKLKAKIKVVVWVSHHTPLVQQAAGKFNECRSIATTPIRSPLTIEIQNHFSSSQWRVKTSTFHCNTHPIDIVKILSPRWSCSKPSLV